MSKSKKILSCWVLAICSNLLVTAQNKPYFFRHLTTADGLASNLVNSIMQDSNGYMWFGTENGLQKYDGYSFITYHHDPADPNSINEDRISFLIEDPYNNIWVKTHSFGFSLFNPFAGKTIEVSQHNNIFSRKLGDSYDAFVDDKKNIWFYSKSEILIKYDQLYKHALYFNNGLINQPSIIIDKICYDSITGNLWMATRQGICTFNTFHHEFTDRFNNPHNLPIYKIQESVNSLFLDRENNLWFSTPGYKLFRYNISTQQLKEYYNIGDPPEKNKLPRDNYAVDLFLQDRSGTIWMGAHNSRHPVLLQYNPQNDCFSVTSAHPSEPDNFQCTYVILSLCEDRERNIWVGTDKGINVFNPYRQKFFAIQNDPENQSSFPGNEVTDFLQQKNNDLWVATWGGGIAVLDSQFKLKKRFYDESSLSFYSSNHEYNMVWSLLKNTDGKIWAGCQHAHLSIFDPVTEKISNSQPPELDQKTIKGMVMDKFKNIWLTLYTSIAKWDTHKQKFIRYSDFIPYKGSNISIVNDILIDKQDNIWVATEKLGLQKFDPVAEKFSRIYVPQAKSPHSISGSLITCSAIINDSLLAFGTGGEGIDLFNTFTNQFHNITTIQGLPGNAVTALYFRQPADLWVTTRSGLCKVNLQNRHVVNYGQDDGINNSEFASSNHFYKLHDGRLLAGMSNGFIYFHPDSILEMDPPPDVRISGFKIFNSPVALDSFIDRKMAVTLSYKENFITIQFASLSYLSSKQTVYYYKLEGVDKDWVTAGNQRFATYTDLKGGNYTFKVKCENRNGIFSKNLTTLALIIQPPFWNTWWFYSLCTLLAAAIIYFLYSIKINKLKIKQDLSNKIARDLHDDIGSSLSGINIYSRIALQKINSRKEDSIELLTRISDRSEKMMDALSDIVWSINLQHDDAKGVLTKMKEFAAEMLEPQKINYSFEVADPAVKLRMNSNIRKEFYLIFKEAINNAAKYALCSHVQITIKISLNHLILIISDNGIGFDIHKITPGNGFANMRDRAKKINAVLSFNSKRDAGTTIQLSVPIP